MHHHPGLRKRERHECAHGKERNQVVGHSSECDQQNSGKNRQRKNPEGKDQATSADSK
jgi:hypothetical protein